jgi:hypothetical protein
MEGMMWCKASGELRRLAGFFAEKGAGAAGGFTTGKMPGLQCQNQKRNRNRNQKRKRNRSQNLVGGLIYFD